MTVYLTMRNKCTCNNGSNSLFSSSFKSNLLSNYLSGNNNNNNNNVNQRVVTIVLLDSACLDFNFDNKTTISELFEKVCNKLQIKEFDVFGLAQKTKDEYYFLPNSEKLYKYASKCMNSSSSGTSNNSINTKLTSSSSLLSTSLSSSSSSLSTTPTLSSPISFNTSHNSDSHKHTNSELDTTQASSTNDSFDTLKDKGSCFKLYFRVQFYLTDPLLLRDAESRRLYYLQLKENFLNINHNISQERYFTLAALSLQADFGNFNRELHKGNYFDINQYFPKWIINKLGENFIMKNIPALHAEQSRYNFTQKSAQLKYCAQLSTDDYPYNLHLYNVSKTKDEINPSICLGIAPKGILVFEVRSEHDICLISTFPWPSVTKLNFDKKKFEVTISIDSKSRRYSYYTNCEKRSKYLFELSKITYSFTVNIFSRLADQKTLANYVTESYKETMFMINDNSFENYQEREICAPNSNINSDISKTTVSTSSLTTTSLVAPPPPLPPQYSPAITSITATSTPTATNMSPPIAKSTSAEYVNLRKSIKDDDRLSFINKKNFINNSTNSVSSAASNYDVRLSSMNSDSTSGIASISDDSSRDSRQNRKRLAPFGNENNDCSELLRKYSSLSCNPTFETTLNNYLQQPQSQQQQQQPQQQQQQIKFRLSSTTSSFDSDNLDSNNNSSNNLNNNNNNNTNNTQTTTTSTVANSSPSTVSSSSTSSASVTSLPLTPQQTQLGSTIMLDGVPMKIIKSAVPVNLHPAQSCYIPNTNTNLYNNNYNQHYANQFQSYQQQQQQAQLSPQYILPNTPYLSSNLEYRQTFSATPYKYKSTPPPPYLYNRTNNKDITPTGTQIVRNNQLNDYLQHYSDSNLYQSPNNEDKLLQKLIGQQLSPFDSINKSRTLLNGSTTVIPPYVEKKKPPSYEESLQKIKHSKDSSMSSTCNQSSSSTCTSPIHMDEEDSTPNQNTLNSNSDTFKNHDQPTLNNNNNKNEIQENRIDEDDEEKLSNKINKITIDEKNLEQIRIKAASMSLPLLTALCSDKSLIRCISKRNETNKQVS